MIRELAQLVVDPGKADVFEAAVAEAMPLFRSAQGCRSFRLERSVDRPGHYLFVVGWESVEAHMVTFRGSEAYQSWRGLVGEFFISPPDVDHVELAYEGFES